MTDAAWADEMTKLLLAFPVADEALEVRAARAGLYRKHLDHLTDAEWRYAAATAIDSERFFPTVARLKELAACCPPAEHTYLPAPKACTDEEQLAINRRGLQAIRDVCSEAGFDLSRPADPSRPGKAR